MLTDKGWTVRRIKIDGGCYEAYVVNEKGERWEAYYHPQTLAPVASRQQTPR
jgi:sulfoxide reductase heme-binding subunit YedZ